MSLVVSHIEGAFAGKNGIKGNLLTGSQIIEREFGKGAPKFLFDLAEKVKHKSGITTRSMIEHETPTTYLLAAAGHRLIQNSGLDRSKIDGLFIGSNAPDFAYPPPEVLIADTLEIKPRKWANCAMGCASIVRAIETAIDWVEHYHCENILILLGDANTKLKTPKYSRKNYYEKLLFGDGAVALLISKGAVNQKGGFVVTDQSMEPKVARHVIHRKHYSSEQSSNGCTNGHSVINDNDSGYRLIAIYDSHECAYVLKDYLMNSKDKIDEHVKVILPQIGKRIIQGVLDGFREDTNIDLTPNLVNNSFTEYGNLGPAAIPAAWYLSKGVIRPDDKIMIPIVALGGHTAFIQYDPEMRSSFHHVPIIQRKERSTVEELIQRKKEAMERHKEAEQKRARVGIGKIILNRVARFFHLPVPFGSGNGTGHEVSLDKLGQDTVVSALRKELEVL